MKTLISLLLLSVACVAQTPSAFESDPKGWIDILPDAAFKGWTRVQWPGVGALNPESQWKVDTANRVLICEGNKGHESIQYNRELGDLIFHAEWRLTPIPGGQGYNSGVLARCSADGTRWLQVQIGDASGGYLFGNTMLKGVVQRVNLRDQLKENRVKPAGEWNIYEIRAVGPKLSAWVNGAVTSELDNVEILKGHVALEAEGYHIQFRNLKLKELR